MHPMCKQALLSSIIHIFEMSCEESLSDFNHLEIPEKNSCTNSNATLSVNNIKSVTSSVGKSSKSAKASNLWYYYCNLNNHNMADFKAIAKFKKQKILRHDMK
jgi:hypothetical protein